MAREPTSPNWSHHAQRMSRRQPTALEVRAADQRREAGQPLAGDEVILSHAVSRGVARDAWPRANRAAVGGVERVRGVITRQICGDPDALPLLPFDALFQRPAASWVGHTVLVHPAPRELLLRAGAAAAAARQAAHVTISLFCPREWRGEMTEVAGEAAMPLEEFAGVEGFAIDFCDGLQLVAPHEWDLWIWEPDRSGG